MKFAVIIRKGWMAALVLLIGGLLSINYPALAAPAQSSASLGLQGTIPSPAPSRAATIAIPANGAVFTTTPIAVSGICPASLLIKLFDNNVFVGSAICSNNGSYSLQIDLFSGQNQLVARDYDSLDQVGPDSNTVNVVFNDAQFTQLGKPVTLGSVYAERGAAPGSEIDWPILLSGGTGPYAISVDWGDGTAAELISQAYAGTFTIEHTYQSAGIYNVIVKVTDKNGGEAFLQLVGQATGAIQHNNKTAGASNTIIDKEVLWRPILIMLPLILIAFWLGMHYQLRKLHKFNE
jgi:hypothetical protein